MNKTKIALGAWAWGNDGTFGDHYTAEALKDVYDTAMENGLNLWDTATVYGMSTSERTLGELIKNTDRSKLILSTKFTPQIEDGTPLAMEHMLESSLSSLNTDYIDVYWIHNPMNIEKYTPMLIPLAQSGKIRQIGVSNHCMEEIKQVQSILQPHGLKISAVQNHLSLLNRSSIDSGILDYCKENDIDFYAYMVLEQGALSGKYDKDHLLPEPSDRADVYNPYFDQIDPLITELRKLGEIYNATAAQIATAWVISKGSIPILGVTKKEQVLDAIRSVSVILNEKDIYKLEEIAKGIDVSFVRMWEKEMK